MSTSDATSARGRAERVAVWDPVVRIAHWLLTAAFTIAYLSAEEETGGPDVLHVWSGYAIGAIVVVRVAWGLVGPQHARFSDFACGPAEALRYLADLVRGQARRYLGHSPAGGVMVIALLACLAGTVATGIMAYGERGKGPLAATGAMTTKAYAEDAEAEHNDSHEGRLEGRESAVGELHAALANITLGLVLLHIVGVGLASFVHRENLAAAMISGKKRAGD